MRTPDTAAGIIGPSQADITAANSLKGPIRNSGKFAGIAAVVGIPAATLALTACVPQRPAEVRTISTPEPAKSTTTPEPGHTPIAIGGSLPIACQTNPDAVEGWKIATSNRPLTAADNTSIDALNACITEATKPGEATATVIAATKPSVTPTTAPAAESTKAPPPLEAKKAEDCGILPPESCSQAELIEWANPNGEKLPLIGLRLTPGTPLLMPVDGKVTKAKLPDNGVFKGFQAQIADPNSPNPTWYIVTGNLQFDDMRSPDLKKGTVFGHIGETGVKNAGDFDLLFYIIQGTGQQAAPAIDKMKEMFSGLSFNKPTTQAIASSESVRSTINTTAYYKEAPAWSH
jgi:hypothetical protein